MKIFIHFDPGSSKDIFEGMRLRKNIKGALELNDVTWVDSIYAMPDVAHLMSPQDETLAKNVKAEGISLVVSALYAEDDPVASFLNERLNGELTFSLKAKKLLELADVILVPSFFAKSLVEKEFPNKRIEIVTPGVNIVRFNSIDLLSQRAFQRYERISSDENYFLIVGDYEDKKNIQMIRSLTSAIPECRFFFLGGKYGNKAWSLRRMNKKNQKNLIFSPIIPDDIYCSALKGAAGLLVFEGMTENQMVLLEAFAAKTAVFYVGNLENSEIAKEYSDSITNLKTQEDVINFLPSFSPKSLEETIMSGYKVAKDNNLKKLGRSLKTIYKSLINKEGSK